MPDLTNDAIESMTAPETAAVFFTLLTVLVDDVPVLYFVDNNQEIVSNGQTFQPCAFSAILPNQSENSSSCKLQIDNTDVVISKTIKEAIGKKITAQVAVVLSTSPDIYEQGPLDFILRNVSISTQSVTADLYDSYMQDRKFTAMTYSPDAFPGMFF